MGKYPWRANVRWDGSMGEGGTFLMRCEDCAGKNKGTAFWPLTTEYWLTSYGLQRCRACHLDRNRHRRNQSIEHRRAVARRRYHEIRSVKLAYQRAYYAAHQDRIKEQRRAAYHRRKAEPT